MKANRLPTFGQESLNVLKITSPSHSSSPLSFLQKLFTIFLCLSLSGCIFIPKYQRPAPPVPAQFPYNNNVIPAKGSHAGHSQRLAGIQSSDIGWKDFFKDPRLQSLIELALKNNRDYRVALLNVEQVRAQYRIVRYGLLPTFEINGSGTRQRQLASSSDEHITTHSYKASVNTAYEVDLFGHIRSLQKKTLENYFAQEASARAARISLVAEVAVQYLNLLALDGQLDLLYQTRESVESYYQLTDKSYQLGNASALDVSLAQTQVETMKANIASYERQRAQAEDALVLLVGQPLPAELPAPMPLASQDVMEDLPAGLSSDLLERRPDILEAEHQLKAANADIGVVRAAFFPAITLTASDGTASAKLSKLFTPGSEIWSFSPQISLPLFNRDTNVANLDAAHIGKRIEIARYEKAVQTAFREVSDALVARDTYNRQMAAQAQLVAAQQERYDLSGARYHNGVDSYLVVLLAQQDLYKAQSDLIRVSLDRFSNLVSLYKALGGGWKEK